MSRSIATAPARAREAVARYLPANDETRFTRGLEAYARCQDGCQDRAAGDPECRDLCRRGQAAHQEDAMSEGKMAIGFIVVVTAIMIAIASLSIGPGTDGWENLGGVRVWTDPKTGCRYTYGEQGMSPIVGADGKPDCARRP